MLRGLAAAFDLAPEPPASMSLLVVLGTTRAREAIEASHDVAVADPLAWLEHEAIVVHSGPAATRQPTDKPSYTAGAGGCTDPRERHEPGEHGPVGPRSRHPPPPPRRSKP
ncbi:relaxase domain-containing protein [Actinacidiphila cocklensis]|uniref:relaxase domain-containing protein n=1 Tax=Actinacidiphila cocklensis TaxID=887465 RepID=UPI003BEF163E